MEKINFTDFPSTETPLNAENLNKLQDNVEEAILKDIMFATNTSGYTTTSTAAEIVPLTATINIGDKLSISDDGGVLIGSGVSIIKASGQLNYKTPSAENGRHALYIYKNSSVVANSVFRSEGTESYQCVSSPNALIEVEEGDIIYLKARSQDAEGAVIYNATRTNYLTVEVVK